MKIILPEKLETYDLRKIKTFSAFAVTKQLSIHYYYCTGMYELLLYNYYVLLLCTTTMYYYILLYP